MFRKGGEVGGGITSGMRTNFQEGTPTESRLNDKLNKVFNTCC